MIASHPAICGTHPTNGSIAAEGVRAAVRPMIAIVEDDESLRPALVDLIRSLGYGGEGFATAEAFLAGDGATRAACILTDYQLPGLSGLDLAARFRNRLPVILITARTEPGIAALAAKLGVLEVLEKPFEADHLAALIAAALMPGAALQDNNDAD
jgi:FixJ family two-component response regulator